jgi:hypothetical protein
MHQHISFLPIAEISKGFQDNLPAPSPDLMVVRVSFASNRSYGSNTSSVELSLLVAKYHDDYWFNNTATPPELCNMTKYLLGTQERSKV